MALATRQQTTGWLQRVQVPLQVALYIAIFIVSERLVGWLHVPLPANIVGMLLAMIVLVALLVFAHISRQDYIGESRWLLWLPGPATLAFAVTGCLSAPGFSPQPWWPSVVPCGYRACSRWRKLSSAVLRCVPSPRPLRWRLRSRSEVSPTRLLINALSRLQSPHRFVNVQTARGSAAVPRHLARNYPLWRTARCQ